MTTSSEYELIETLADPLATAIVNALAMSTSLNASSPYMTVREAAEYMRCKPQRVYDLLSARTIPKYRDGSRVLLKRDDLDTHLSAALTTTR